MFFHTLHTHVCNTTHIGTCTHTHTHEKIHSVKQICTHPNNAQPQTTVHMHSLHSHTYTHVNKHLSQPYTLCTDHFTSTTGHGHGTHTHMNIYTQCVHTHIHQTHTPNHPPSFIIPYTTYNPQQSHTYPCSYSCIIHTPLPCTQPSPDQDVLMQKPHLPMLTVISSTSP